MAGELFVYSAWARLRVLGLKVGKPPLISWLESAEVVVVVDELAPREREEDSVVNAVADDDVRAQRSAPRMGLPIFIVLL